MWATVAITLAVAVGAGGCGGAKRSNAPSVDVRDTATLAWSVGVDPRNPAELMQTAPVVTALGVPARAEAGRRITSVFQTRPDASCQMEIAYENRARNQLLAPVVAGHDGLVSWTWIPDGRGTAVTRVVCSGGQRGEARIRIA